MLSSDKLIFNPMKGLQVIISDSEVYSPQLKDYVFSISLEDLEEVNEFLGIRGLTEDEVSFIMNEDTFFDQLFSVDDAKKLFSLKTGSGNKSLSDWIAEWYGENTRKSFDGLDTKGKKIFIEHMRSERPWKETKLFGGEE